MTETIENVSTVKSIVIYRGQAVAASISFPGTNAASFIPAATVSGQLNARQGELSLTWLQPTAEAAGEYKCMVNSILSNGQNLAFGKALHITDSTNSVSMRDLLAELNDLKQNMNEQATENLAMKSRLDDQKTRLDDQETKNVVLNTRLYEQETKNVALKTRLDEQETKNVALKTRLDDQKTRLDAQETKNVALKTRLDTQETSISKNTLPAIMFTVGLTKKLNLPPRRNVIYDRIITNVGGYYNKNTGVFIAPVNGYYHFEVHGWSIIGNYFFLELNINGRRIIDIDTWTPNWDPKAYRGTSNGAFVLVNKHDKVRVKTRHAAAALYHNHELQGNTFSGRLVALI